MTSRIWNPKGEGSPATDAKSAVPSLKARSKLLGATVPLSLSRTNCDQEDGFTDQSGSKNRMANKDQ
jgi:hypothetical protein